MKRTRSTLSLTLWLRVVTFGYLCIVTHAAAAETSEPTSTLTIAPTPDQARVRILNIKPSYQHGIQLAPGSYELEVSHPGYVTTRQWIKLGSKDRVVRIGLQQEEKVTPPPTASDVVSVPPGEEVAKPDPLSRPSAVIPAAATTPVWQPPQVGRYSELAPTPKRHQIHLLDTVINVQFGPDVSTVGTAVQQLLSGSGYTLASETAAHPALADLLQLPLPQAHRRFGPVSLRAALRTLAGPAWTLVTDPVHRQVSFDVADSFQPTARVTRWP